MLENPVNLSSRTLFKLLTLEGMLRSALKFQRSRIPSSRRVAAYTAAAAPTAPPATDEQLTSLVSIVRNSKRLLVLTGAGCSTESGVPDYRSPQGAYSTGFKPMTHQQFLASPANRARYWARSFHGWPKFSSTRPNAAHAALAELEQRGWVNALITQNVDRLHQAAGSHQVLELHGTTHEVICLGCGSRTPRHVLQSTLAALNPTAAALLVATVTRPLDAATERLQALAVGSSSSRQCHTHESTAQRDGPAPVGGPHPAAVVAAGESGGVHGVQQRPDGDVELLDAGAAFSVAPCEGCGGLLKPDVVFFGDNIPPERKERADAMAANCDALMVVGSSVMVYSAFRLVGTATKAGAKLMVVNVGPTRVDNLADIKIEARAGEVLTRLARHPELQIPNV